MTQDESPFVEEPAEGVDRRAFVKGAIGAATLGVAGAAGFGLFKQSAIVKPSSIKNVKYLGAKVLTGSPAPRGLPIIPIRVNDDGIVEGIPEDDRELYLDWYRYCSHENAPGLADPEFTKDNTIEYFLTEEKLIAAGDEAAERWWYHDRLEQPIRAADFANRDFGTGAAFRWRSSGLSGNDVVTGIVLKLDPSSFNIPESELERYMDMEHNLIAFSSFCTHFCCVPGWKEDPTADKLGFWDMLFCTCHNSRYDPRELTEYTFDLKLEVEGDDGGGGGGGGHGGGH